MPKIRHLINEEVAAAKGSLSESSADDVVERCRAYLESLAEYREQLFRLSELPEIDDPLQTITAQKIVTQAKEAVRLAIEITVSETKRTEALLTSFTSTSIRDAAETLNTFHYDGSSNWEIGAGGLRFSNGFVSGFLPTGKALETASRLRREAYELLHRGISSTE
jgi:hypothetical protein